MFVLLLAVSAFVCATPANGFSLDLGFHVHNVSTVDSKLSDSKDIVIKNGEHEIVVTKPVIKIVKEVRKQPEIDARAPRELNQEERTLHQHISLELLGMFAVVFLIFAISVIYVARACLLASCRGCLRSGVYVVSKLKHTNAPQKVEPFYPKMDNLIVPTDIKVDGERIYPHLDLTMIPEDEPLVKIGIPSGEELAPGYKVIYSTGMPPRPPV